MIPAFWCQCYKPFLTSSLTARANKRWSGNSLKWQLIETATHQMPIGMSTHRMPFKGGNSSKKFTHKSPTFDELPPQWPPQWQLTECPLRWQLTECPLEVPFTESTINHSSSTLSIRWMGVFTCPIHWKLKKLAKIKGKGSTGILCSLNLTFGQASPSLSQLGRALLAYYPDLT